MDYIESFFEQYPNFGIPAILLGSFLIYRITRYLLARILYRLAIRTENVYDDLIVDHLHPFRIAWIAPLLVFYSLADSLFGTNSTIKTISLFLIIWVITWFLSSLLNALNEIYEHRPSYSGISIKGYVDLAKIFISLIAIILSASLFTGESVVVLLSGLGALTAIILLIFQDTILAFVSNIQIASLDLIKEGDWISVPSFGADGIVVNMTLHSITIQNADKTLTSIPTRQVVQAPYKNYRGIAESGGRRLKRSLVLDQSTIKFCDSGLFKKLQKIELLSDSLEEVKRLSKKDYATHINEFQKTNVDVFISFMEEYLKSRDDIHKKKMLFLVRTLPPTSTGMGVEIYVFTHELDWKKSEIIQRKIFNYLLATLDYFDLKVYQLATSLPKN